MGLVKIAFYARKMKTRGRSFQSREGGGDKNKGNTEECILLLPRAWSASKRMP